MTKKASAPRKAASRRGGASTATDRQQTLREPVEFVGEGVHTGRRCRMTLQPARANSGLRFRRIDLPGRPVIPATVEHALPSGDARCTVLGGKGGAQVLTPEHLLAACGGLGVDNASIELDQPECPILDGGAKRFAEGILGGGLKQQRAERRALRLQRPLLCRFEDVVILALPSDRLMLTYFMEYDPPYQLLQQVQFTIDPETFQREIAPARTYVFYRDIEALRKQGLIKGGNINVAVVLDEEGRPLNDAHFSDEAARHKILDLLGDLTLLGRPVHCHVLASRSGHASHIEFVKLLKKEIADD